MPVTVSVSGTTRTQPIDMRQPAPLPHNFISLGTFDLQQGEEGSVEIKADGAGGNAHADAIQIVAIQ